nr:PREDICTED: F-box only protein 21-like isoform X2 [Linepithema humile]
MATIMDLPHEVISIILCKESVSIKDIVSFALTCKEFNEIINDNVLWRKKFYQRWPLLREEYDELLWKENIDFREQVKAGIKSKKQLWNFMSPMHKHGVCHIDLEDLHSLFDPDKDAYFLNYYFFVNELILLLLPSIKNMSCKLDIRQTYYLVLFFCLHRYHLKKKWYKFINYPEKRQILEEAATILVQWYYPLNHVSYMSVRTSLDNIAQKVLEYLINHYPAHPIFSISAEQFSFWKYNNIDDNHWHGLEARQILESLCKVLHNTSGFFGNFWKCLGFQVLKDKFCNWLPLGIIYISVARRLGMCCDLVSSPFHFLFWRRKFNTANFRDSVYFHFDDLRCDSSLTPGCRADLLDNN